MVPVDKFTSHFWLRIWPKWVKIYIFNYFYTPRTTECFGGIGFNFSISVCPSGCGQICVCSVSSPIIVGSILYSYTLSSNFRRCVACWVLKKNSTIGNFAGFFYYRYLAYVVACFLWISSHGVWSVSSIIILKVCCVFSFLKQFPNLKFFSSDISCDCLPLDVKSYAWMII